MADINDVKSVTDLLSQVTEGFSHFFTNLEGTLEKLSGIPNLLNGSNDSLKKTGDSARDASNALDKTHAAGLNLLDSIKSIAGASVDTFKAIGSGSEESVANLGKLNEGFMDVLASATLMSLGAPKAFDSLIQSSKNVNSDITNSLLPNFDRLINVLSKATGFPLLDGLRKFIDTTVPAIDGVNNLENSLLSLHGTSGDLSNIFLQTGASETNLTALTNDFNNSIKQVAENTGASVPSIIAFTGEILKIPDLYGNIIKTDLAGNISFVEAAMKVARGTTQNYGDVMGVVSSQYENMNIKGQGSLELMSRMYSVGQTLGIPFNYISSQVKNASDQFKFLGDNTQGALNIIEGLSPKLLASGLGPKAVQELIGGVIGSISQLDDVAKKSLLSSKTGGAGGLQGGFQIDQLLAEGKVDEVYKKMETALKQQFGGKIATLKEGSESQSGAAQLQKEVAYLTNGPFGSLVKSSAEAYKLLESFKSGQSGVPTKAKTETELNEGLNRTIDTGRSVYEAQYTEAQKIANNAEMAKIFSQQQLGQSARSVVNVKLENKQAVPISERNIKDSDPSTQLAYITTNMIAEIKNAASLVANKIELTKVENNASKSNNNLTPVIPSPDRDAAQQRQNILNETQSAGTVLASTVGNGDQTLTIKVVSTGVDNKTEERLMAKFRVAAAQLIEKSQEDENSSAVVGHN